MKKNLRMETAQDTLKYLKECYYSIDEKCIKAFDKIVR